MSHTEELEDSVQNELGEVYPCDCGGVNLTMGPMSLHLSGEEVVQLQMLVNAGVDMVNGLGSPLSQVTEVAGSSDRRLH